MLNARPSNASGVLPLATTYLGFGLFWGTWSVVYLEFVGSRSFSNSRMSLYLLTLTVVSVVTMVLVAPKIVHLVPAHSLPTAVACYGVGIALMPFVPDDGLFLAFGIAGLGTGMIDVLVNQTGHRLEAATERPVLQMVHMSYSLGAVIGALVSAGLLVGMGEGAFRVALLLAALGQIPALVTCFTSPVLRERGHVDPAGERISLVAFVRHPALLATGLIVLSAFFVEGSLDVWAVTYLRASLDASVVGGALGFAAFGLATAVGRGFAARILFGMGYKRTILFSGIGSAAAGIMIILAPTAGVAAIAYLILGFCLASAGPAAFGSIEGRGAEAGVMIAAVTTMGYTGFVIGPPVMGKLADDFGIRATMIVITLATFGILLGGFLSRVRSTRDDEAATGS